MGKNLDNAYKDYRSGKKKRGPWEDYGDRVSAAMDSNLYGLKDDGSYGWTTHPGIVDNAVGLLNYVPMVLRLGAGNWRESGHGTYADNEEKIAKWIEDHLPDFVKNAPDRQANLVQAIHENMGLSDPEGFTQNSAEALGNMLTQIPLSKAASAASGVKTVMKAIPEYLGPTIRPSVSNYASGAIAGGLLPEIPKALQYLADKYQVLKQSVNPQSYDEWDRWDEAHPALSVMPGMAKGGKVYQISNIIKELSDLAEKAGWDKRSLLLDQNSPEYLENLSKRSWGNGLTPREVNKLMDLGSGLGTDARLGPLLKRYGLVEEDSPLYRDLSGNSEFNPQVNWAQSTTTNPGDLAPSDKRISILPSKFNTVLPNPFSGEDEFLIPEKAKLKVLESSPRSILATREMADGGTVFPRDESWYNNYGFGPEHNWGIGSVPGVPMVQGSGGSNGSGSGGSGPGGSLTLSDMLSAIKTGKYVYNEGKDLYHSIFGDSSTTPNGTGSVNTGLPGSTTSGTLNGTPFEGTQVNPSLNEQLNESSTNPSSSTLNSGSLSGLTGGGLGVLGSSLGSSTAAPTGQVIISEVGDNVGLGGAGAAGSGAGGAGASTAGGAAASDAATDAGAGLTGWGWAGPVGAILGMVDMLAGDEIHGAHSVTGGNPLPGQSYKPIPGSPQSMLMNGNLGRGAGNDASQGSGQWFYNGDPQYSPSGKDGWLGATDSEDMDKVLQTLYPYLSQFTSDNVTKGDNGALSIHSSGQPGDLRGQGIAWSGSSDNIPATITLNPDGTVTRDFDLQPVTDPSSELYNPNNTYTGHYADTLSLMNLYNEYGGQKGWGVSYPQWIANALGIYGNMSGSPHG